MVAPTTLTSFFSENNNHRTTSTLKFNCPIFNPFDVVVSSAGELQLALS